MWLLALVLAADTAAAFAVPVAPAESLWVSVSGSGEPVVLVPGLFGSGFGYRQLIPRLNHAGYRTIVVEPLGVGRSARSRCRGSDWRTGRRAAPRTCHRNLRRRTALRSG